jgi:hypothetical protein
MLAEFVPHKTIKAVFILKKKLKHLNAALID